MKLLDFEINEIFWNGTGPWLCTDIGSRVIVAVKYEDYKTAICKKPPYDIVEYVLDEYAQEGCVATEEEYHENYRHNGLG